MEERAEVTRLLAKMFSERNSALANQNTPLWMCFVGRYIQTNLLCVRACVCVHVHACVCVCACVCAWLRACV